MLSSLFTMQVLLGLLVGLLIGWAFHTARGA